MSSEDKILKGKGKRRVRATYEKLDDPEELLPTHGNSFDNTSAELLDTLPSKEFPSVNRRHDEVVTRMNDLRLLARQSYLGTREIQKYQVLLKELQYLEEDVEQYGWENLSKSEQDNITIKRELVELIEQKQNNQQHSYTLHDNFVDDNSKLNIEDKKKLLNNSDAHFVKGKNIKENLWEEQQLQIAVKNPGTDDIHLPDSDKYDYVFDTDVMIDFTNEDDDQLEEKHSKYENKLIEELAKEEKRILSISETRKLLPVYQYRNELLKAIEENQILIVVGETGSGKTTQLPQYLVEDGYTKGGKLQIAVTQPRRVAATSVAARVADEMNVLLGKEVGYSIRFEDKTTPNKTVLKYMTDGMLLREFLSDPELSKYACIMIDEAHERTLATDILLGLLKDILPHRKDLKLLISSATMNATKFSQFFYDCPIFNVPGRRYPVDIHYTIQPEANYIHATMTTIFQIHTSQPLPGDILVFLTGQEEIQTTKEKLEEISEMLGSKIPQMLITPIYANLPQDQQERIFQETPENCRKIVLATNIAETSLTIDGIRYVIDPGFVKENSYVPATGMSQLLTVPCSRASVDQRAGRAGRVGPGKCFRIFTKWSCYNELEMMPKPEIVRTNISNTVLLLLSLGITDLINFPLLDKPSIPALSKSLEILYILGALNSKGSITRLGRIMCDFPCEPEFAKVMYTAATYEACSGVLEECITIVSMLHETTSIFIGQSRDAMKSIIGAVNSDHMLYLEIYNQWKESNYSKNWCNDHKVQFKTLYRVRNIREQLWKCCDKQGFIAMNIKARKEIVDPTQTLVSKIAKCFISGFPMNIAKLGTSGYVTTGLKNSGGLGISIHPSSVLFQKAKEEAKKPTKYILYQQLMLTTKEFVRVCMPIVREAWLTEMVPHVFKNLGD